MTETVDIEIRISKKLLRILENLGGSDWLQMNLDAVAAGRLTFLHAPDPPSEEGTRTFTATLSPAAAQTLQERGGSNWLRANLFAIDQGIVRMLVDPCWILRDECDAEYFVSEWLDVGGWIGDYDFENPDVAWCRPDLYGEPPFETTHSYETYWAIDFWELKAEEVIEDVLTDLHALRGREDLSPEEKAFILSVKCWLDDHPETTERIWKIWQRLSNQASLTFRESELLDRCEEMLEERGGDLEELRRIRRREEQRWERWCRIEFDGR